MINPIKKGNGVKPMKVAFQEYLASLGWHLEYRIDVGVTKHPGPVDAVRTITEDRIFAVEWETGNISSSHRALNKMTIGILRNVLDGGIHLIFNHSSQHRVVCFLMQIALTY